MSLHCTYTALSLTSEMKPEEIQEYNSQNRANFKVVTAEEYDLARRIQQASAMGNNNAADELRVPLKAQQGRRLHVTSKDPTCPVFWRFSLHRKSKRCRKPILRS